MKDFYTVQEASRPENLGRSPNWIRACIKAGIIKAEKAGNAFVISVREIERIRAKRPVLPRFNN